MKKFLLLFVLLNALSFILTSCGDDKDEPKSNEDKLVGYWALTHIKTIEHVGDGHNTSDKDVPAHGEDSYATTENYRYDVLIFDEDYVTVRGDMPSHPHIIDYNIDTIDGQLQYENDLDEWYNAIGSLTDALTCPVGTYCLKGNDLIIGSLNMGVINFNSDNEFTLDYKKPLNNTGDYRRLIYTYTRIYSLTL